MSEFTKFLKKSEIKIAHPGDAFNTSEAEQSRREKGFAKIESEERILKSDQKLKNKINLFNTISKRQWGIIGEFSNRSFDYFHKFQLRS